MHLDMGLQMKLYFFSVVNLSYQHIIMYSYCVHTVFSRASQLPHNPLKIPAFMEFEELFWSEYKLRQSKLKNDRKVMVCILFI